MKVVLTLFVILSSFYLSANLSLEGSYQGKNIYVQNPEDEDGFGFCATRVTVNGDVMAGGVNRSAFEIDFGQFELQIGDEVFIVIEHGDGCTPKVLNPEVLLPMSTFVVTDMKVDEEGNLKWTTTGEEGKLPFIIEQYRWNKWVNAGEVEGTGTPATNSYRFQVVPHSGENKVRVVQIDHTGTKKKSPETTFDSDLPEVEMTPKKVKSDIQFKSDGKPIKTKYEIYDAYGNIVKKGYASSVNCENLRKGAYYINFDNKNEKFIKG